MVSEVLKLSKRRVARKAQANAREHQLALTLCVLASSFSTHHLHVATYQLTKDIGLKPCNSNVVSKAVNLDNLTLLHSLIIPKMSSHARIVSTLNPSINT